jgi:precorrin-6Y C5,15-methyltransferase (decarboxylating)
MITVIGYDGSPLDASARKALDAASLVVGGRRHLDAVGVRDGVATVVMGDVAAAVAAAVAHHGDVAVLASGDPGLFGVLRRLRAAGAEVTVHPAVSSVAVAFARVGLPWDDAVVVSVHGRDRRPALAACRAAGKVAVLTDRSTGPAEVAASLPAGGRTVVVCERLGELDERVTWSTSADVAQRHDWREPNVVLLLDEALGAPSQCGPGWLVGAGSLPGVGSDGWALPDDAFDHRDSMITKREVRAHVLARLGPRLGTTVWDIGAGSGSVAVECARLGAAVVAVERDGEQCVRVATNSGRHGVRVEVVHGTAPAALAGLPAPDALFVGGGGPEVVAHCASVRPQRLVVALAAIERVGPTWQALTAAGYAVDGVQLAASRLAALPDGTHRLAATNPVVVVTGVLPAGEGA